MVSRVTAEREREREVKKIAKCGERKRRPKI
jgi:hypothetical protein